MLEILTFTLGPVQTNAYLIADPETKEAAVIDPAWDGQLILAEAQKRGWRIGHLWYTHAHVDHIGGAAAIADALPLVALHPADHVLWRAGGGGKLFGFPIDPGPEPSIDFGHGQTLQLGSNTFEIRHVPGHTPGHVVLYCAAGAEQGRSICFCGDLIFAGGVGRVDLPGGSWEQLVTSIRSQIYTLPDATRLLSGHGPETTVGEEKVTNPYVQEY
jgi:glyoxylase-like metal-dependent hydrolase (beta-lactamase superfamily II)